MELIPYQAWHYELLAIPTLQGQRMGKELVQMYATAYAIRGDSFTIKHEGKIIGCAGVVSLWPGVGEAWTMLSDTLKAAPFFLHRNTFRILRRLINDRKYHRVQSIVWCCDSVAIEWIKRLGFEWESDMKKYGCDGTDYAMYVRTP